MVTEIDIAKLNEAVQTVPGVDADIALGKLARLEEYLKSLGSLAVGFSSGVDSTFLLSVAHAVLADHVVK